MTGRCLDELDNGEREWSRAAGEGFTVRLCAGAASSCASNAREGVVVSQRALE